MGEQLGHGGLSGYALSRLRGSSSRLSSSLSARASISGRPGSTNSGSSSPGTGPALAITTANHGSAIAAAMPINRSQPCRTKMANTRQTVRMPIDRRYLRVRPDISSEWAGFAEVTRCTCSSPCPLRPATLLPYAERTASAAVGGADHASRPQRPEGAPHERPHLPGDRDRRYLDREPAAGRAQRSASRITDLAARRLVRGDPDARAHRGGRGRALPGDDEDRLPPRGRLTRYDACETVLMLKSGTRMVGIAVRVK